jgi:hypothetical protein
MAACSFGHVLAFGIDEISGFQLANRGARGRIFEGEIIMTMTKTTFL